jgi:hypothetical protein
VTRVDEARLRGCRWIEVIFDEDGALDDVGGDAADVVTIDFDHPHLRVRYPASLGAVAALFGAQVLDGVRLGADMLLTLRPHGPVVQVAFEGT